MVLSESFGFDIDCECWMDTNKAGRMKRDSIGGFHLSGDWWKRRAAYSWWLCEYLRRRRRLTVIHLRLKYCNWNLWNSSKWDFRSTFIDYARSDERHHTTGNLSETSTTINFKRSHRFDTLDTLWRKALPATHRLRSFRNKVSSALRVAFCEKLRRKLIPGQQHARVNVGSCASCAGTWTSPSTSTSSFVASFYCDWKTHSRGPKLVSAFSKPMAKYSTFVTSLTQVIVSEHSHPLFLFLPFAPFNRSWNAFFPKFRQLILIKWTLSIRLEMFIACNERVCFNHVKVHTHTCCAKCAILSLQQRGGMNVCAMRSIRAQVFHWLYRRCRRLNATGRNHFTKGAKKKTQHTHAHAYGSAHTRTSCTLGHAQRTCTRIAFVRTLSICSEQIVRKCYLIFDRFHHDDRYSGSYFNAVVRYIHVCMCARLCSQTEMLVSYFISLFGAVWMGE